MEQEYVRRQLQFFADKRAGCLFAAAAARDPLRYGWVHRVVLDPAKASTIDQIIIAARDDPKVSTLSLLFPLITSTEEFLSFIQTLRQVRLLTLEQIEKHLEVFCLGFRAIIGPLKSYVTGFGDLPFLPATRRAPYVEISTRVKPRPNYGFVFKDAPPGIIHLADMDMLGMQRDRLWELWNNSFVQTKSVLGGIPDIRSAARTTYCIPEELYAEFL